MSSWLEKFGFTKTEKLPSPPPVQVIDESENWKSKYLKLKNKYKNLKDECALVASSAQQMIDDSIVLNMILRCIVVQSGGLLEISPESIKIAKDMDDKFELSLKDKDGSIIYEMKRKEDKNG